MSEPLAFRSITQLICGSFTQKQHKIMLPFLRHAAILAQCITVNVCRRLLLIFIELTLMLAISVVRCEIP